MAAAAEDVHLVQLYVYDISRGMAKMLSRALVGKHIEGIWHTGVVAYGREYFFGAHGISNCVPGGTILGEPDDIEIVGETQIPYEIFYEFLTELEKDRFRGSNYHLLSHNCNTFSNELSEFLVGRSIPAYIRDLPKEVLTTPIGAGIASIIDRLGAVPPSFHPNCAVGQKTPPGGSAESVVAAAAAATDGRNNPAAAAALASSVRFNSVDFERFEDGDAVTTTTTSVSLGDGSADTAGLREPEPVLAVDETVEVGRRTAEDAQSCAAEKAVIQRMAEETEKLLAVIEDPAKDKIDQKPKEPPIVFRTISAKDEYSGLCKCLGNLAGPEDRQAMSEIKEYAVEDEGAWALSDDTIHFIGKLLHDKSLPPGVRAHLLRLLAASALKDDIILLLHQDRKEHLLMNYAQDFDRLPVAEQDALTFFICNLFENTGTSEWLLYISEWTKQGDGGNSLSNVRVTTKVAVNSLLSDNKEIQEKGTAIMHNLAGKEKLARNSVIRKVLPRGSKSQVFDDVATELSMAILQYLAGNPPEEYLFRVLKSLLKFCQISYNDVPALIKMIGPEPKKFKGVSPRVDDLIEKISIKVDGAAYRQPEVPA